ncbi:Uncharacterised protein [Enterobacter cloacae]|uniref:Uncharacterized protein n=1 Tax=Enterobacter cloacae TaxID=550 RepID=A0A377M1N2_ENTCL|nr:Uncharacterised protein [Enterobacter cloacae]
MRDGRVFNWRVGVMVVILLGFILYPFRDLITVYENLQGKMRVNEQLKFVYHAGRGKFIIQRYVSLLSL